MFQDDSKKSKKNGKKNLKARKANSNEDDDDSGGANRYFEMSPNSQPIVSIIPRRLPKGVNCSEESESEDSEDDDSSILQPIPLSFNEAAKDYAESKVMSYENIPLTLISANSESKLEENGSNSSGSSESGNFKVSEKRQRLLGKVLKIKGQNDSSDISGASGKLVNQMPTFFKFN